MRVSLASASLVLLLASGCGTKDSTGGGGSCDASSYPCANVGTAVGQTIENLSVGGTQRDDNQNGSPTDDPVRTVQLSDYRNQKGVKVLAILVASVTCIPCQNEQPEAVQAYKDYAAKNAGVAILEAITQDAQGKPATQAIVDEWATKFKDPFDMTYDPTMALAPYSDPTLFPSQMVIRTSDMQIMWRHNGYTSRELESQIDAVLNP